jgi:pimeloyl-ACP methyl ester carboxylesterase
VPIVERAGAGLHYAVHGSGPAVLALAPGGMRSAGALWERAPWDPVAELAATHSVIVMDQRNAGASSAPVTGAEGWDTYAADQLAVLDHAGVDTCAYVGMCIGGAFGLALLRAAPDRISRAALLQPIGLDGNREAFGEMFEAWSGEIAGDHPEAGPDAWTAYRHALYGGDDPLFSVRTEELAGIRAPVLVLRGNDLYHPASASQLVVDTVPGARLVERWKEPGDLPATRAALAGFLGGQDG